MNGQWAHFNIKPLFCASMKIIYHYYLNLLLTRPLIPIIGLILISIFLGAGILKLQFDSSIESFMPKHDEEYIEYSHVKETYGDNDRFIIMAVSQKDLWSADFFSAFNDFLIDLEEYQNFDAVRERLRLEKFLDACRNQLVSFREIIEAFPEDPAFIRFLTRAAPEALKSQHPLDKKDIAAIEKAILKNTELKKTEIIDNIISPFTIRDISGDNDTLKAFDLVDSDENSCRIIPRSSEEIDAFRKRLMLNPVYRQLIYATAPSTGEITDFGVLIKFVGTLDQEAIVTEINRIADSHTELNIIVSGVPYINKKFNDYIKMDLKKSVPLVMAVIVMICFFNFRSIRGVILPITTLGMAEIWTLGLMGHLGFKITSVGGTLPPLLVAVGSSYSIHILNQYYADFNEISKKGKVAGLKLAMNHISVTVFLAGFTTFAAFLTLVTNEVSAIREWAIFSAIGIMFAVFISVTLIPSALAIFPHRQPTFLRKKESRKSTMVERLLPLIAKAAVYHPKKIFVVVAVVIAVSIAGAMRLKVDTEFLHYFKENDPARQNVLRTGDKFGGGWGFSITLDAKEIDGVKSPEFLNTVEEIRHWLLADENADLNVGRTDAFSDFIKRMHMAMNNDDPYYFTIPQNKMDILDYLEIFSGKDENSDGRVDDFEPFVDDTFQKNNIHVRLTRKTTERLGTTEINYIIDKVEKHLADAVPKKYSYMVTGYPVINVKLSHYVVMGQMQNLLLSLVMVMSVIMLLFKKFTAGPLALIDMGVTILINFGIMGWFGIELDMITSIIASITVGIGVDDTIHFLNTYRFHKQMGMNMEEAIENTTRVTGKAIIFTSLALICGFFVQITSNFLPIVLFAILITITMINTTIGSILLIPSAIRLTGIDLGRSSINNDPINPKAPV